MISKKKIKIKNEVQLRNKLKRFSKLQDLRDEIFECKEYLRILNLEQIRMKFKLRTKMFSSKMNMKTMVV